MKKRERKNCQQHRDRGYFSSVISFWINRDILQQVYVMTTPMFEKKQNLFPPRHTCLGLFRAFSTETNAHRAKCRYNCQHPIIRLSHTFKMCTTSKNNSALRKNDLWVLYISAFSHKRLLKNILTSWNKKYIGNSHIVLLPNSLRWPYRGVHIFLRLRTLHREREEDNFKHPLRRLSSHAVLSSVIANCLPARSVWCRSGASSYLRMGRIPARRQWWDIHDVQFFFTAEIVWLHSAGKQLRIFKGVGGEEDRCGQWKGEASDRWADGEYHACSSRGSAAERVQVENKVDIELGGANHLGRGDWAHSLAVEDRYLPIVVHLQQASRITKQSKKMSCDRGLLIPPKKM